MVLSNDPAGVRAQYANEARLSTRSSVWRGTRDGRQPQDVAADAIARARPQRLLEVGCGTGAFAERLATENCNAVVVAIDRSPRLVELTAARGIDAHVADVMALPFADAGFDVVVAMWMLYHVPDLHQGLAEIRRVLRPNGALVAATNGDEHLTELLTEAGGAPLITQFSTENGSEALHRHFDHVSQTELATQAVFCDHAQASAYLATFDDTLAASLPHFDGPREYAGATSVFVAR
ncbi:MAG: class I SAM-dependent methyltransferase [Nocardioidaceae bacterium]|nr:class I SAM-dependent methyltransferase [Nocardioidaceae bacterium]